MGLLLLHGRELALAKAIGKVEVEVVGLKEEEANGCLGT